MSTIHTVALDIDDVCIDFLKAFRIVADRMDEERWPEPLTRHFVEPWELPSHDYFMQKVHEAEDLTNGPHWAEFLLLKQSDIQALRGKEIWLITARESGVVHHRFADLLRVKGVYSGAAAHGEKLAIASKIGAQVLIDDHFDNLLPVVSGIQRFMQRTGRNSYVTDAELAAHRITKVHSVAHAIQLAEREPAISAQASITL